MLDHIKSSNGRLSLDQLEQDETGLFADVTPAQLFSKNLDPILAARVYRLAPRRYRELKREYAFQVGEVCRPDAEYC